MSTVYVQVDMPITQIHCLDEAIKMAGGTWQRPEILNQIATARKVLVMADDTVDRINANYQLAKLLKELATSKPLDSINITIDGINIQLTRSHGRYTARLPNYEPQLSQIQSCISKLQSNYQAGVKKLKENITETLKQLEEQKDILSSEQLEGERVRLQNEKLALESANKQRVVEVTKELEEKLAARGFEIRKRMIGKKIVYQAVRR